MKIKITRTLSHQGQKIIITFVNGNYYAHINELKLNKVTGQRFDTELEAVNSAKQKIEKVAI